MPQDIIPKQQAFVTRYSQAICNLLAANDQLIALGEEWDANGYAAGAPPVSGTSWEIGDEAVQAVLPAATAAMLGAAVGAAASVSDAVAANIGYLIVMKP